MKDFYKKLVDLYAGGELPAELNDQMELAAHHDPEMRRDMETLTETVRLVRSDSGPEFDEDAYMRILNQIYSRNGIRTGPAEASPLQYQLPISI